MESVQQKIEKSVQRRKKGEMIFLSDYREIGSSASVKMALSRMVSQGKLKRLAHGIYYVPQNDPLFGYIYPAPEKIAEAVAKKEKVRIKPTGTQALHKLGLSTQVPTRLIYLTDGERRQINVGKIQILFKPTTPKKMSLSGPLSSLVILALDTLGIVNLELVIEQKIIDILRQENPTLLKKDLAIAPVHIHDYILKLLNRKEDDRLVKIN
jgi:hypothetical protein